MKVNGRIEVFFPDENSALAAAKSMSHEAAETKTDSQLLKKRSTANSKAVGKKVIIKIKANDVVALRATANAYLRNLQVFEGIEDNNNHCGGAEDDEKRRDLRAKQESFKL
jgi:tRNA threonylcarbamoyladenosine modification (KEOPS) complex  Pcc1 subunit